MSSQIAEGVKVISAHGHQEGPECTAICSKAGTGCTGAMGTRLTGSGHHMSGSPDKWRAQLGNFRRPHASGCGTGLTAQ